MQFVARNVAKVQLDSTPATAARNVARKVVPCVRAFRVLLHEASFSSNLQCSADESLRTTLRLKFPASLRNLSRNEEL